MDRLFELLADNESVAGRLVTSAAVVAFAMLLAWAVGRVATRRSIDPYARYYARKAARYAVAVVALAAQAVVWRPFAGNLGVVLSVLGVNPAMPHWRMERMVRSAGLVSTALRPAYFADNLLTAFGDDIRRRSQLRLAAGNGRVSFIDVRDVAAVAARILADPGGSWPAATTLTGFEALTFGNAAVQLGAELGRPVRYVPQRLLERRRELRAQGAEPGYVRVQLVIDVTTRLGLAAKVTDDVPRLLGRPATTLARFVHDNRAAWC